MAQEHRQDAVLDGQQAHWEQCFAQYAEMFGELPSEPAQKAAQLFQKEHKTVILELGGGQGRDTMFFAQNGFQVCVVDYSKAGLDAIEQKAKRLGLSRQITTVLWDVRQPLPFADGAFDACYSHMLLCMALTTPQLQGIMQELKRVLQPSGLNLYTARNTNDAHYKAGIFRGEDLYEAGGFIVHFFSPEKVQLLAEGFRLESMTQFEEGPLPRILYQVVLRK